MTSPPSLIQLAERWRQMALAEAEARASLTCLSTVSREQARDILAMFELADRLRAQAQEQGK